jgi:trigger factor
VNIRLEKHSELEATVVVELEKNDYTEKVESQLKKIQKSANIKGFRPGKAPLGMIQKMYGKSVLAEEIQNLASEALNNYIDTEKLETLGYPIGSTRIDSQLDIDNSENFSFAFDLGMAPQFELNLDSKDKLDDFEISVSDKEVDEDIDYARKRHAKLEDADKSDAESIVYAEVTELNEKGEKLEGGVENKPVSFVPSMIEDKKLQKQFIGVSKDAEVTGDVRKLFNDNESVISNALGLPKEGINDLSAQFSIKVTDVKSRILPELTEEYFKEVLPGEETPKNEEEYKNRVKTNLEHYYKNEASLWLDHEIGHLIMQKHDFNLPDEFLKRWLITTKPEHYTEENINEKYAQEREALKRRLIIDKIAAANELQATESEVIDEAKVYYAGMYRQYGLNISMGDEFLASTVMKRLEEREFVMQMSDRVIYRKAYDKVRELITLKTKKVNVEEYFNHVNKHKEAHGE